MPTPSSTTHQALLTHLVQRVVSDIDFLSSRGLLDARDAQLIKAKLPRKTSNLGAGGVQRLDGSLGELELHAQSEGAQVGQVEATTDRATCRAVWDYHGSQPDDLAFSKGQLIVLESELNQDWWQGSIDGRKGIFPSNHVQRLPFNPTSTGNTNGPLPPPRAQFTPSPSPAPYYSTQPQQPPHQTQYAYQPPQSYATSFPSGPSPYSPSTSSSQHYADDKQQYVPPPPQQQMYQPPPPLPAASPVPALGTAAPQPPPVPKKRFGKVGGQLGTAFVGGLGFGTGTAVASNAINAIF